MQEAGGRRQEQEQEIGCVLFRVSSRIVALSGRRTIHELTRKRY